MKPIFTAQEFQDGLEVANKLLASLHGANVPVPVGLVALMAGTIIAADIMQVPLESILEHLRVLRKGHLHAKAQAGAPTAPLIVAP